jgi:integrase
MARSVITMTHADTSSWSLADLIENTLADTRMWKQRCIAIARELRLAAKLLRRDPAELPAGPVQLHYAARQAGVMDDAVLRRRWHALRPALRAGMERWGLSEAPGRYHRPLDSVWEDRLRSPDDAQSRAALSRLVFYLSRRGIAPTEVGEAHVAEFHRTLVAEGLVREPNTVTRLACKAWNASSRGDNLGMPRLVVPSYENVVAMPAETFPFTLRMEVEAYLAFRSRDMPASGLTPIRPRTVRSVRFTLVYFASLLVRAGVAQDTLDSLSELARPDNVRLALDLLDARDGGRPTKQAAHITSAIHAIGRIWLRVPASVEEELKRLCVERAWRHEGIARKNRILAAQFEGGRNVKALLRVPHQLVDLSLRETSHLRAARMIRAALAFEILLTVPIHIGELLALDAESDIIRIEGASTILRVVQHRYFSRRERRVRLGPAACAILDHYLTGHRPELAHVGNTKLFPGRSDGSLATTAMREDLCRWSARLANVSMTPTMFRHFAAKHYLEKNPGDFNVVRGILGHRLVKTTLKTYGQVEAAGAASLVDRSLFGELASADAKPGKRPAGKAASPAHIPARHRRSGCRA